MKLKRVGAVLAGAALLGATFAGAVASADTLDSTFFIDETNGLNNCLIVVGSGAAAADVVSAAFVSAKVGTMAYYEDVTENWDFPGVTYDGTGSIFEEKVINYIDVGVYGLDGDAFFNDFQAVSATAVDAESWVVLPYDCGTDDMLWDYDVYVDPWTGFNAADENFLVDTLCSYEAITVDFSLRNLECSAELCVACSAACVQVKGTAPVLNECETYPNIYPRHYWGVPNPYTNPQDPCDPLGGIEYRTIVTGVENLDFVTWWAVVGPESEAYGTCDDNGLEEVQLYCESCDVFFLGENYDALSFDTDADGYDYMFYGTPKWFIEEKLYVGESKEYFNGWTLTINDLGIYENKADIIITDPDGNDNHYMVVIDTYTSQVPSQGEGDMWDGGIPGDTSGNEENDCIAFVLDSFNVYSLCGDELEGQIDLIGLEGEPAGEVVFAVNFVKTMIGAAGNYMVEYHAYTLEDYGVLREQVYPGPCDPAIEPAIKVGDLEWYFDIIPNDNVDWNADGTAVIDKDNLIALWDEGNPNYDRTDDLNIYGDIVGVTVADDDFFAYLGNFYNNLARDGADVITVADRICRPILELWLATPVELAGLCDDELIVELADCDGDNYFTLKVTDTDHTDYAIDGAIDIYRKVALDPTVTKVYVDIEPESLVKLDENITTDMKQEYNLVLIGGPVANAIVQELVDLEYTTFEKWDTSEGEFELIEDVYAVGKDVLIVAGMDRDATAVAALALISEM